MRNVEREDIPKSLRENAEIWAAELLEAIEKSKKDNSKVQDTLYDRYKKNDVKTALVKMYGDGTFTYCCYCESTINNVSFEHIEHRMPKKKSKDKYPEKTYDWDNLNLACELCNGSKKNQYDEKYPILDPTGNEPIIRHLGYKLSPSKGVYRETLTRHGITTVKHADLDRESLRMSRLKVWNETIKAISEIKRLGEDSRAYTASKMLWDLCAGEYGSLIQYLLNQWSIEDVRTQR